MPNRRPVFKRDDGDWVNKKGGNERVSSVHNTHKEAEAAAKEMLQNGGGGELTTHGRDGKIRSGDTIPLGHDPNPPRDKEQ
jgi:hypothetical protein